MKHLYQLKQTRIQGFVLPLILLITLVLSIVIVGQVSLIGAQSRYVSSSRDKLIADFTAEAGAKRALRKLFETLTPLGTSQPNTISGTWTADTKESILSTGGKSYTYKYRYVAGAGSQNNPERIEVQSTATINKMVSTSKAWIVFNTKSIPNYTSPNLIELITSANTNSSKNCYHYASSSSYNTHPWTVSTDASNRQYASPELGTDKNYILFNNNYTSSEFRLDYNVKFVKETTSGSGGAGVIYGASDSDTGYSFNAYCVKFNNDRQAFSVTKFYKESSNKIGASQNEYFITNSNAGTNAIDKNNKKTDQAMFQPNGTDSYGNQLGNCSITFTNLKEIVPDFDPATATEYTITIKTKFEDVTVHTSASSSKIEKRLRQIVLLNGVEVLNFVDLSDVNPVTKNDTTGTYPKNPKIDLERKVNTTKKIRTGLRVVGVKSCSFYNSNVEDDYQEVDDIRRIIWKK